MPDRPAPLKQCHLWSGNPERTNPVEGDRCHVNRAIMRIRSSSRGVRQSWSCHHEALRAVAGSSSDAAGDAPRRGAGPTNVGCRPITREKRLIRVILPAPTIARLIASMIGRPAPGCESAVGRPTLEMGFRPLRKKDAARVPKAVVGKSGARAAAGAVSIDDLLAAKKAVVALGGTERALEAIQALRRLEGWGGLRGGDGLTRRFCPIF